MPAVFLSAMSASREAGGLPRKKTLAVGWRLRRDDAEAKEDAAEADAAEADAAEADAIAEAGADADANAEAEAETETEAEADAGVDAEAGAEATAVMVIAEADAAALGLWHENPGVAEAEDCVKAAPVCRDEEDGKNEEGGPGGPWEDGAWGGGRGIAGRDVIGGGGAACGACGAGAGADAGAGPGRWWRRVRSCARHMQLQRHRRSCKLTPHTGAGGPAGLGARREPQTMAVQHVQQVRMQQVWLVWLPAPARTLQQAKRRKARTATRTTGSFRPTSYMQVLYRRWLPTPTPTPALAKTTDCVQTCPEQSIKSRIQAVGPMPSWLYSMMLASHDAQPRSTTLHASCR